MRNLHAHLLTSVLVLLMLLGSPITASATGPIKPKPEPTPVGAAASKRVNAELGQPFALHPGQEAYIEADDFSLTLRSLSEDSGCFSADDCSVMMAEGTLAVQAGDEKELLDFSASMTPDSPFTYEFGDYVVAMTHVEHDEDGELLATFTVTSSQPAVVAAPEPRLAKRCAGFSKYDAAAILQADVSTQPIANLVFAPLAAAAPEPGGICGYYVAATDAASVQTDAAPAVQIIPVTPLDPSLPYLATDVGAAHAATAGRLEGADTLQLLHLLALVSGGEQAVDDSTLMRLQTVLAAGLNEDFLSTLYDIALANPAADAAWLEGTGAEALWLSLPANDGQFVVAISRDRDGVALVEALVSPDVSLADAQGFATTILRRLTAAE